MNNLIIFRYLITLLIIVLASQIHGQRQSKWELHSTNRWTNKMVIRNDTAYLATSAGLWIIDVQNNTDTLLNALNSRERGFDLKEIAITESGNVWMSGGNELSLYQYDGQTVKNYYQESEDQFISYAKELITSDDELWFWNSGDVWSYADDAFIDQKDITLRHPKMQFDSEKNLWLIDEEEVFQVKNNITTKITEIPEALDHVIAYYIDSNDRHWLCTQRRDWTSSNYDYFLFTFKDGIWTKYDQLIMIEEFVEQQNGELQFFSSFSGFGKILENEIIYDSLHHQFPNIFQKYDRLEAFHLEKNGTKWLLATNYYLPGDLYRVTEDDTTLYSLKSTENIHLNPNQILKDCEDNIYAIDGYQLQKFQNNAWTSIPIPILVENRCFSLRLALNPHTCDVWAYASTNSDCFSLWKLEGDQMVEYGILPRGRCSSMDFDKEGNIYLVIQGELLTIDSVGASHYFYEDMDSYSQVFLTSDDTIWAIGQFDNKEKVIQIKDGQTTEIDLPDLNGYPTGIIFENSKGNIIFREGRYLHEYDGSEWTVNTIGLGLDVAINSIEEDNSGNYWLGIGDKGIAYWDGSNTIQYNVSNSQIPSNNCYNLVSVNDSTLWMRHRYGISMMTIDPQDLILDIEPEEEETELENEVLFSIFPNPSSGHITITHPELDNMTIDIFAMAGAFVSSHTSDALEYSLTLETGIYWVRISEDSGKTLAVEKIVVLK